MGNLKSKKRYNRETIMKLITEEYSRLIKDNPEVDAIYINCKFNYLNNDALPLYVNEIVVNLQNMERVKIVVKNALDYVKQKYKTDKSLSTIKIFIKANSEVNNIASTKLIKIY